MLATRTDPTRLAAVATLLKAGFRRDEVCRQLKIRRSTYYSLVAEIREFKAKAAELIMSQ